jgi:hypothetical protein
MMRQTKCLAVWERRESAHKVLVWKSREQRPLWRPIREWQNTKLDRRETGWERVVWMQLAQDRGHCWAPVNGNEFSGSAKFCEIAVKHWLLKKGSVPRFN